jgi:hypothetical protein
MRKIVILALTLTAIITSNCGNGTGKNSVSTGIQQTGSEAAVISFREYEHNFGKIAEGEKVAHIFTFENKGKGDLVITSATTSCGCTVPKYDSKPISPGKTGNLEVVFDASGRNGMQTKTITVKSNASTPVMLLKITAEVVPTLN